MLELERTALAFSRLNLHVAMPDLDENWLDGYESAQRDMQEGNNPYHRDSAEHTQWNEGWWAGFYSEDALFNWADAEQAETPTSVCRRIQQAACLTRNFNVPSVHTMPMLFSHMFQCIASIIAFALCYQFADLLI